MSVFIDTTDVANLRSGPDILSLSLERVTSLAVLSLPAHAMPCHPPPVMIYNSGLNDSCLIISENEGEEE